MKYGRFEYERSYLVNGDCLLNQKIKEVKIIKDKYIKDTILRLREVTKNDNSIFKLTRKENLTPTKHGVLKINTFYLTNDEFNKFNILEGYEIEKKRHLITIDHVTIGVDCIEVNNKKLYLAEVEFETEESMNNFIMPLFNSREVTGEQKYSGYEIAKEYSKYK